MGNLNYQYPIDETWTKEEIIIVAHFLNCVEKAYESSIDRNELLNSYNHFKKIVASKGEEKVIFSDFQKNSSYSSYHVVKEAKNKETLRIKMSRSN